MEKKASIGSLLKEARVARDLSLNDVSDKTKINLNILKQLENDDLTSLPNKTYVKGFVKNYARTLGVDINEALDELENTYQINEPISETKIEEGLEPLENKINELEIEGIRDSVRSIITTFLNKKVLLSLLTLIVLYFIGKGLISFFVTLSVERESINDDQAKVSELNKEDGEDEDDEEEHIDEENFKEELEDDESIIKSKDESLFESDTIKKLQNQQSSQNIIENKVDSKDEVKKEESKVEVKLKAGELPYKEFYPAPQNMFSIIEDAPENNDESLLPRNIKDSLNKDKQNVYIKAIKDDTWLSYQVDDEQVKRFVLSQGKGLFLQGNVILLFMGNLNATHVFYNNKLINAPTSTGVKSLIFPESEAPNFQLPLFPSHNGVIYSQKVYKEKMLPKSSN